MLAPLLGLLVTFGWNTGVAVLCNSACNTAGPRMHHLSSMPFTGPSPLPWRDRAEWPSELIGGTAAGACAGAGASAGGCFSSFWRSSLCAARVACSDNRAL